jgi:CBS domain-containing protein
MTNREVTYIVKDQKPLVLAADQTVQHACQSMWEHRAGSVLVVDDQQRLSGIFTGRDAVRVLAKGKNAAAMLLAKAKTSRLITIAPESRAIDALRTMSDGGFRHVPVTENEEIWGVVSRGDFKGMEVELFLSAHNSRQGDTTANRELAYIVKDQQPLVLTVDQTVQHACRSMWEHKAGSVLVVDDQQRLSGIFTGRHAVRVLAKGKDAAETLLVKGMTREPVTIAPQSHAIDALRTMSDHGFRHLPVIENGRILGVVSRSDFTGTEIDRLDEEEHLWECIR